MKAAEFPWGFFFFGGWGGGNYKFPVIWSMLKSVFMGCPDKLGSEQGLQLLTSDREKQSHRTVSSSLRDVLYFPSFHSPFMF